MKHRIYLAVVLTAVLVLVVTSGALYAQPSFVIPLTVSDDSSTLTIHFGLHPGATYCDSSDFFFGYQEQERFPEFVPGPFEVRFKDPGLLPPTETGCFGHGSIVDFRPGIDTSQADTFFVVGNKGDHVGGSGPFPVHISWPAGLSSVATKLEIHDFVLGVGPLVADMLTSTNLDFTPAFPTCTDCFKFYIIMKPAPPVVVTGNFLTVSPDTIVAKTIAGKYPKVIKRPKVGKPVLLGPTWTNLWDEVVLRGGFQPLATESDSAGGMRIGLSHVFRKNPADPLAPKWTPFKIKGPDSAWVRLFKWNFKKSNDGSGKNLPKALENKTFNHMTPNQPRGLDSTLNPLDPKRKMLKGQLTKLDPKKTPNRLFAEMVALKFNIAASQMGNTPVGFGELVYHMPGNPLDGMEIGAISAKIDTDMTVYLPVPGNEIYYDSLYESVKRINRAFLGALDTALGSWTVNADSTFPATKLILRGSVPLSSVSFLSGGPTPPRTMRPTNDLTEGDEEFEDDSFDESEDAPVTMKLYQNFPNPFNPTTSVAFRLLEPSQITLKIYNILGQEVATLLNNEELEDGYQTVQFAANNLASGVYFYRIDGQALTSERQISPIVGKMMLLK